MCALKRRLISHDYKMLTMGTQETGISYCLWGGEGKYPGGKKVYIFHCILLHFVLLLFGCVLSFKTKEGSHMAYYNKAAASFSSLILFPNNSHMVRLSTLRQDSTVVMRAAAAVRLPELYNLSHLYNQHHL